MTDLINELKLRLSRKQPPAYILSVAEQKSILKAFEVLETAKEYLDSDAEVFRPAKRLLEQIDEALLGLVGG